MGSFKTYPGLATGLDVAQALSFLALVVDLKGTSKAFHREATDGFQGEARVAGLDVGREGFFGDRFAGALGDDTVFHHGEDSLGSLDEFLGWSSLALRVRDFKGNSCCDFRAGGCVVCLVDGVGLEKEGKILGFGFENWDFGAVFLGGEDAFAAAGELTTSHASDFFELGGECLAEGRVPRTVEGLADHGEVASSFSEERDGFSGGGWDRDVEVEFAGRVDVVYHGCVCVLVVHVLCGDWYGGTVPAGRKVYARMRKSKMIFCYMFWKGYNF